MPPSQPKPGYYPRRRIIVLRINILEHMFFVKRKIRGIP
jgi:hypothetical protein